MTANIDHIVGKFLLATEQEKVYGTEWYPIALKIAERISQYQGVGIVKVVGVIAALSPNNKWERNCLDAENIIAAYVAGGVEAAENVKTCTYTKNKAKAIKILTSAYDVETVVAILSGPKVTEFFHCIMGICDDVCINGHAYSVWFGERLTMKEVPSIGIKLRRTIKADYRASADRIFRVTGEHYTAAQIQAITWVCHKRIHGV